MSGTSLDGISAAVARFTDADDGRISVDLLAYTSRQYTPAQRTRACRRPRRWHSRRVLPHQLRPRRMVGGRRDRSHRGSWSSARRYRGDRFTRSDYLARARAFDMADRRIVGHRRAHGYRCGQRLSCAGMSRQADRARHSCRWRMLMLFASGSDWRGLQNLGGIGNVTVVLPTARSRACGCSTPGPGLP